jgi:dTMP kinase
MALFITFEGGEGCGKSTQTRALSRRLAELAIPYILTHEPGGTPLGEKVRYLLKQATDIKITALTELVLFESSRSQLVAEVIKPALQEDKIVICDRFADSSIAYQVFGRGLDLETVEELNRIAVQGIKPNLTFLLDVAPEIGLARKQAGVNDRFEQEQLTFHQKVRQGFLSLASLDRRRWVVIDASLPRTHIAGVIWNKVSEALKVKD